MPAVAPRPKEAPIVGRRASVAPPLAEGVALTVNREGAERGDTGRGVGVGVLGRDAAVGAEARVDGRMGAGAGGGATWGEGAEASARVAAGAGVAGGAEPRWIRPDGGWTARLRRRTVGRGV